MNSTSTKTGKALIGQILKTKKSDFIPLIIELLELFNGEIFIDDELSVIISDTNSIFYCLATDHKEFKTTDMNINHIEKIINKYPNTSHITIVYNRNLIDKEIQEKTKEFTKGIVTQFSITLEAFTPNAFVEYIFSKSRDILYKMIDETNESFKKEYQQRMSQENIYLENIPYSQNSFSKINPKKNIHTNFIDNNSSKAWVIVKSEFGFGKTSLLLNLANDTSDYKYIYIPISQFLEESFKNETELALNILSIISQREFNTKDILLDKILVTEFRQLLRHQKDIVLLYDGLDEHHLSYKEKGLKQIFTCTTSFVCNAIFTVRKEFLDERSGNFEDALEVSFKPKNFEIELLSWQNKNILEYIEEMKLRTSVNKEEQKRLEYFKELVSKNRYEEIYGDIPKRPLFLKMLVDDIIHGETSIKNISELYENYLIKKFRIDREGSVLVSNSSRPLALNGDRNSVIDYIFEILSLIAWHMVEVDGLNVIYSEYVEEKKIKEILKDNNQFDELIELLINSVLIPFEKRQRRSFKAKFAHKSFHEYFLAYYLVYFRLANLDDISAFNLIYTNGTINFCKYMIESEDLQEKIDQLYINSQIESNPHSFLYRLSSIEAHQLRYKKPIEETTEDKKVYDLFISHASEDKLPFVESLVDELNSLGLNLFYDKRSIGISENIVWGVNKGFRDLKYGTVVVISPRFLDKSWCNEELSISYSLKIEDSKKLIPIFLNMSVEDIKKHYPILRATKMIDGSMDIRAIANQIDNNIKGNKI